MNEPWGDRRVGLVGQDGRTDAIADACRQTLPKEQLFAVSSMVIPGLASKCQQVTVGTIEPDTILRWAQQVSPDLVIVGPEDPLARGVVDELTKIGVPCFGPTRDLAQIEASKIWARQLLDRHGIDANPAYEVFDSTDGLREHLVQMGEFVVKPEGLTGGKGVRVYPEHFESIDDAVSYAADCIAANDRARVLIEERLEGEEFSLMTITDGRTSVHCPAVQDHKRAYEGDTGPNTGGMGSYSCADWGLPFLSGADVAQARGINELVIEALLGETGQPYRGVLYGGFILTADGVRLIEYNARFGDPEALNVLPIMQTDFVDVAWSAARGHLDELGPVDFEPRATVCKYLVPASYPGARDEVGEPVSVPTEVLGLPEVRVYWASCEQRDGQVLLTGSRSLAVVGIGKDLREAEVAAEAAASSVQGPVRYRSDIGTSALIQRRIDHMSQIRAHAGANRPGGRGTLG